VPSSTSGEESKCTCTSSVLHGEESRQVQVVLCKLSLHES
jgi:hypothetical protein